MNLKRFLLIILLIFIVFLMIFLTTKGVSISTTSSSEISESNESNNSKKNKYVLENVKYLGYEDDSCYRTVCDANFKFTDGTNIYKLTGGSHEMETLVVDSSYDVYYDNYSKEIKNYSFPQRVNSDSNVEKSDEESDVE